MTEMMIMMRATLLVPSTLMFMLMYTVMHIMISVIMAVAVEATQMMLAATMAEMPGAVMEGVAAVAEAAAVVAVVAAAAVEGIDSLYLFNEFL